MVFRNNIKLERIGSITKMAFIAVASYLNCSMSYK